jgi:hypothetical protein
MEAVVEPSFRAGFFFHGSTGSESSAPSDGQRYAKVNASKASADRPEKESETVFTRMLPCAPQRKLLHLPKTREWPAEHSRDQGTKNEYFDDRFQAPPAFDPWV